MSSVIENVTISRNFSSSTYHRTQGFRSMDWYCHSKGRNCPVICQGQDTVRILHTIERRVFPISIQHQRTYTARIIVTAAGIIRAAASIITSTTRIVRVCTAWIFYKFPLKPNTSHEISFQRFTQATRRWWVTAVFSRNTGTVAAFLLGTARIFGETSFGTLLLSRAACIFSDNCRVGTTFLACRIVAYISTRLLIGVWTLHTSDAGL